MVITTKMVNTKLKQIKNNLLVLEDIKIKPKILAKINKMPINKLLEIIFQIQKFEKVTATITINLKKSICALGGSN